MKQTLKLDTLFVIVISCFIFSCRYFQNDIPVKTLHFKGAALAHVHTKNKGYGSNKSKPLYEKMQAMGYNSIQLNTFAYYPSLKHTKLSWSDPTLLNKHVEAEIKAAHAMGFSVFLKPHIWVGGYDGSEKAEWRNKIDYQSSKQLDLFFESYSEFLLQQAQLAQKNKIELLAVGTELVKLTKYENRWRDLIADIRRVYSGKLVYASEAWNVKNIKFWDALDYIGLDMYHGFPENNSHLNELNNNVQEMELPDFKKLVNFYEYKLKEHDKFARSIARPLLLTEIGFPSHHLAIRKPHGWPGKKIQKRGSEFQQFAWRAFSEALINVPVVDGLWVWKYVTDLNSYEASNYENGFIMQGKESEKIIQDLFSQMKPE